MGMTSEIPVTQAREELADLINRVAYGHERIVLTRHSRPVACIVPAEDLAKLEGLEREDARAEDGQQEASLGYIRLSTSGDAATTAAQPAAARIPGGMPIAARDQQRPQC